MRPLIIALALLGSGCSQRPSPLAVGGNNVGFQLSGHWVYSAYTPETRTLDGSMWHSDLCPCGWRKACAGVGGGK